MGNLKLAFIFPGQGSQTVGMGREMAERFPEAREVFDEADEAYAAPLSDLCWNGPEVELQKTAITQPAILATSTAALRVLSRSGIKPNIVAGHSVGEYAALVAAGVLEFRDAIRLTKLRGQLMEAACPQGTGSMAAIIGMDEEQVRTICRTVVSSSDDLVADVAGLNCPGQVVVAGHIRALSEVIFQAKAKGAASATMLRVSGPFHSSLMSSAESGLTSSLEDVTMTRARTPVITNIDAQAHTDPGELRSCLLGQLTRPVLWQKSVELMAGLGIGAFIELGAGRVLLGMVRRTSKDIQLLNVGDCGSLDKTLGFLQAEGLVQS